MIYFVNESVFDNDQDALINTINTYGVMSHGIALEFSCRYPNMYQAYVNDCNRHLIKIGELYSYKEGNKLIINFPTKENPKLPSKIEYVIKGLEYFQKHYKEYGCKSFSFPLLGCTSGQLDFESEVKPLMIKYLSNLDADIYICLNNEPIHGRELDMLNYIKHCDLATLLKECNLIDYDINNLSNEINNSERFFLLKNKKIFKTAKEYRKVYKYVLKNCN